MPLGTSDLEEAIRKAQKKMDEIKHYQKELNNSIKYALETIKPPFDRDKFAVFFAELEDLVESAEKIAAIAGDLLTGNI